MAEDRLMFGIGFDLNSAVDKAEKDFEKVLKELQQVASKNPVSIDVSTQKIDVAKDSIIGLRKTLSDLGKEWDSMSRAAKFDDSGNLTAEAKRLIENYSGITAALQQYGQSLKGITADIKEQAEAQMRYLSNDEAVNKAIQARTVAIQAQRKAIEEVDKKFVQLNAQGGAYTDTGALTTAGNTLIKERIKLTEKLNQLEATGAAAQRQKLNEDRQAARESEKQAAAIRKQAEANEKVAAAQRKRWQELRRTLSAEETSLNNVIAKLKVYQNTLNSSESGSRQFNNAVKEVNRLSAKLEQMRNNIANLTGQAVAGQRRMTSAVQDTNRAYSSTEGYITRLIKRSAVLFGIHQVSRFTQKLRETTAEFELQRVSLGAIIQDTEKANALFNQIKTFAVQSPFEIKDLVGYVKQLSAYRIETDKLFDTTKRLADVSAGLGVDMGRLILAYGQVKAASVLRGQEVRQFTEAGIPLIQLLADKFTALRGEVVSTSEVFDLISQRAVSFEMVAEIFEDMTNAGGMFYNMQEKQAQTLAGQWSNLKDSLSIMYDEMGNTAGAQAAMKGMISLTKTLADNWELVGGLITQTLGGAAILGVVNKFKAFVNVLKVQMYSATEKVAQAQDRYTAAVARQNAAIATGTKLEQVAAAAKVKSAAAALKAAQGMQAAAAGTNVWTFAVNKLKMALKANWLTAIIGVLVTAAQVIAHVVRKTNELKNSLAEIEREGAKNIATTTWNFERLAKKAVDAADGSNEQREALEELQRTYKDMIPTHQLTIENLRKLEGNYRSLTDAVREYAEAQIYVQKYETILANTQEKASKIESELTKKLTKGITEQVGWFADRKPFTFKYNKEQLREVYSEIKRLSQTTADDIETILSKAFKSANITLTKNQVKALTQLGGYSNNFEKLVEAWRNGEEQLADLNDEQERSNNKFAQYGKYINEATDAINKWKKANKALQSTAPFDFNKQLLEKSGKEYRAALEKIINEANKGLSADKKIKIEDSWFSGEYMDTTAILNALQKAGIDIESQAYKSAEKIQKAYMQFVPSTEFVKAVNGQFERIGKSMGDNVLNVINQDLMQSDEGIDDYVKRFFDTIESLKLKVKQKEAELKSPDITNREAEEQALERLKTRLKAHEKMVSYMEQYRILQERGGSGDNAEIQRLKLMVSLLEKVYAKYKDYLSIMSQSEAEAKINDYFGETLSLFEEFGIALPRNAKEFQAALRTLQAEAARLGDTQLVETLGFKWGDVDFSEQKAAIERELKRLSDEVSRTKTAKEFFDKMLNMTGDREISATVTMSVYGDTGKGLHDAVVAQIREAFKGIDDTALNLAIGVDTIDYKKLREIWEADKLLPDNLRKIPSKFDDTIKQILDSGDDANRKLMESFGKLLLEYDEIAQKRVNVEQKASDKIREVNEGLALYLQQVESERATIGDEETDKRIQQAKDRADAVKAAIESEKALDLTKLSDLYIRFFDSIHTVTKKEATNLRTNLRAALFKAFQDGSITASQLRKELKALDEQFEKLINDTGFFGTYLQNGFDGVIQRTKAFADELDAVIAKLEKGDTLGEGEKSFLDKILKRFGTQETGKSFAELFSNANGDTAQMAQNLQGAAQGMQGMAQGAQGALMIVDAIIKGVHATIQGIAEIRDQINAMRSDTNQLKGAFWDAFEYLENFDKYAFEGWERLKSGDVVGAVVSTVQSIISIFGTAQKQKVERLNKDIERQAEIIDRLEYSYSRLQKEAEKVFGSEYVANFRKQQENLRAQIAATEKQLAAEQDKGKGTDDDKVKEYQQQIRELKDQLSDLTSELSTQMLGTDLASAARSFAQSWLDAYKEFGDTRKAIEGEMEKLMENLIVEAALGQVMKTALKDVFKLLDEANPEDLINTDYLRKVVEETKKASEYANTSASVMMQMWEQAGFNFREMGSELTGISKDIASASEESILGLSSLVNTSLYYVSHIDTTVSQMLAIMQGGGYEVASGEQLTDLITIQNQHLAYLPNIALNTAQTAERCERAAQACESIAENLNRVIKPNGVPGTHRVVTSLQS